MDLIEQKPVIPPLQRQMQLETDFFCHQCGYNLHGQIVSRDERLDLLICRCPECGRFHPAGLGVSATRPWLARAGIGLIVIWVMFAIGVFLLSGFFMGLFTWVHLETFTTRDYDNASRYIINNMYAGPIPRILRHERDDYYSQSRNVAWKVMGSLSIANALLLGGFCAVAMWHVRKNRLYLVLGWPILTALITYGLWWANENLVRIAGWSMSRIAIYAIVNIVAMAIGLQIGRPVARFVLRVVVPPKLRQHTHFLWTCDGKTPPMVRSDVDGALA